MLIMIAFVLVGCSSQSTVPGGSENPGRFAQAEKLEQFIKVNKSVDCKGTLVTIEKILLDKTGTFMIVAVEGDVRGSTDSLHVDLFDDQGRELGRSSFQQKLPGEKRLLTFNPVESVPESLRLEFFGGPVGYGIGPMVLDLNEIDFRTVDKKYVRAYQLAETVEKNGYRLVLDTVTSGINETQIHYKLTALGDYDGIVHGWLYDWLNNYNPEGEILAVSDSGRKLGVHLSSINCFGPYYRVSLDQKNIVGRAYFDAVETHDVQVKLTNIYGYYVINEIIPLDGVREIINLDKKIPVGNYTICLKSFGKEDGDTWMLDYSVLDSAGNRVDAAIDAGIYMKADKYRYPLTFIRWFKDAPEGDRRLVMRWQPMDSGEDSLVQGTAIKIDRLGIRQEDAMLDINLSSLKKSPENRDETAVMAAVNDYYNALGNALIIGDPAVFEKKYGYLEPTGSRADGVNDWRRHIDGWRHLGVTGYSVSFNDPIVTVTGNTASADLDGFEKIQQSDNYSVGGFHVVIDLEKERGKWKITKVDEYTEEEMYSDFL